MAADVALASHTVHINHAPVLTLWAAVVADRLGYDDEAALTLGKAVAGVDAQSKGGRLGMFADARGPQEAREPTGRQVGEPCAAVARDHAVLASEGVAWARDP
jgi:hypothetical protein